MTNQYAVGEEEVTSGSKNTEQTYDAGWEFDVLQIQNRPKKRLSFHTILHISEKFLFLFIID